MSADRDLELDTLFEQARKVPPEPSADFLARVLSDGEAMQPASRGVMQTPVKKRTGLVALFAGFSDAIGGWPAFAGLASAAVTGLYIGIYPPESLISPISAALGEQSALSDALEFGDGFDFTQFEG